MVAGENRGGIVNRPVILIVDDDRTNILALEGLLSHIENVELVTASNGDEAVRLLSDREFALIILDVCMPEMSGFDVAADLRENGLNQETPFLFVTAYSTDEKSVMNGYELGAADYITKPYNSEILLSKVRFFIDLYEKRKALEESERKLRESEDRLRTALETVNDGLWDWNIKTGDLYFSRRYYTMLGYNEYEFSPSVESLKSLVHPDDVGKVEHRVETVLVKGGSYSVEMRMRHRNGEWRWILSRGQATEFDKQGNPVRVVGTHVDITELKNVEMELRKSEASLAMAQRIANMGSWERNLSTGEVLWSDQMYRMFGYSPGEVEPTLEFLKSLVVPEDRNMIDLVLQKARQGEKKFQVEYHIRRRDGAVRHILSVGSIEHGPGTPNGCLHGVLHDITERKEAEAHLIEQQEILDAILSGIKAAFLIVDPITMEILDANEQAETLLGLKKNEAISRNCPDLLNMDFCRPVYSDEKSCFFRGDSFLNREVTLHVQGGAIVPVSLSRIELMKGGESCIALIMFDITEKKGLERQLAFAQKLEAVGQLASGIAHEINTPIQYIGGNLSFMESSFEKIKGLLEKAESVEQELSKLPELSEALSEFRSALEDVNSEFLIEEVPMAIKDSLEGVEQVASIVFAMKRFSHPDIEEKKAVDINESVENVVTVARNEWKYASDLELHLSDELPLIQCYPGEINQAILNVLVNAAHANNAKMQSTGRKGQIDISTGMDGDNIVISISDSGVGIKEKDFDKVFDPFFTTKEVGKGTGQGLSITYSIIEKHGGRIDFESEAGKGTTFRLIIPADVPDK